MFLVKKYLARIFFPLPLCSELLIIGLLLLWLSKRQRLGKSLVFVGVLLLLLVSNGLVAEWLLYPLESAYPPLDDPAALSNDPQAPVRWVAVLGGGITRYTRLIEGARVQRGFPGSKLLLSVGYDDEELAHDSIEVARMMGLRQEELILIQDVRDTREEVQRMSQTIGTDRFVLVTSASHMPRAMALFQGAGMNPLPAPTERIISSKSKSSHEYVFPSSASLAASERAFYEYLGLLWLRLAG